MAAVVVGIVWAAIVRQSPSVPQPSAECETAFREASRELNDLYATHPFYGDEYDQLYSDGELSDEEQIRLQEMMADEQAQFEALIQPILSGCSGVADLYSGAFKYRNDADWALQENEYITREDARKYFVVSWCEGYPESNACSDYDADDWR